MGLKTEEKALLLNARQIMLLVKKMGSPAPNGRSEIQGFNKLRI